MGLFRAIEPEEAPQTGRPLADRMRPQTLDEFIGQEDLLGIGKPLRTQIERDDLSSMLFWGPPGCGKTTLARIIAKRTRVGVHSLQRGTLRNQRDQGSDGQGRRRQALWPAHHRVRRRGSPFQPRAAGRLSAACRGGKHPADRRHHRKSVLRGDRPPALTHEGVRAARALDRSDRASFCARRCKTPSAGWEKSMWRRATKSSSVSRSWPMATRVRRTTRSKRSCSAPNRARTAGASSPKRALRTCFKKSCCPTTKAAKSTTI